MSYDQLSNLESGRQGNYSDDPDFQTLQYDLKNKLQKLLVSNRDLSKDINSLGTKKDNPRLRERVNKGLESTRELCRGIGEGVKRLQTWDDLTKQQKYEQTKVSSDFQTALQEFQNLQRRALDKEKASVSAARAAHGSDSHDQGGSGGAIYQDQDQQSQLLLQEQQQLAPQDEVDFQESLIIEREEEIRNIEQGVGDLNVLFTQVAHIVAEQDAGIMTLADNVDRTHEHTMQADRETRQAARYQKAARNKSCCLLLIMGVILTIVILAIVLG
ncbi:hypothetical protein E4U52_007280 [Claviceps spartinae]|nr:hypothetical protein E4U52_007280 [Claviceps spartinae]